MKQKFLLIIISSIVFLSCGQQVKPDEKNELIASKDGYELTEEHFETYLQFMEEQTGEPSNIQTQLAIKSQLKQEFLKDPAEIITELAMLIDVPNVPEPQPDNTLAQGHRAVRQKLGNDIGQMNFDSASANQLRTYLAGSLLRSSSSFYDGGAGGYSYAEVLFCTDGTYSESLSGGLVIDTPNADAHGRDSDVTPGYWEVASLPNNTIIVLFYSAHPNMLEDSANGFLPMPIQRYTQQVVYLPGGEYYERIVNQCVN